VVLALEASQAGLRADPHDHHHKRAPVYTELFDKAVRSHATGYGIDLWPFEAAFMTMSCNLGLIRGLRTNEEARAGGMMGPLDGGPSGEPGLDVAGRPLNMARTSQGPVAGLEFIKNLGANGGGFFNANGAHPYESASGLFSFFQHFARAGG